MPFDDETVSTASAAVFKSTLTESENWFAMARSGLPSPFMSPVVTEMGELPATNCVCGAKEGVADPGALVFRSTLTVSELKLAVTRSGSPLRSRSPIEMQQGSRPVANWASGAKEGFVSPRTVVFKSTFAELADEFAIARSGLPSPSKSPIETEIG